MKRVLSQAEIDSLLSAAHRSGVEDIRDNGRAMDVSSYNFRRPDRVSKEQLRSLHFMHDRFAVNVSTSLSAFLRSMTEVSLASVEQFAYSEFLMSLPDPTAFYALSMAPLDVMAALEINPSIAFAMVDRMLGGAGQSPAPNRALTEIEQNVMDAIAKLLLDHLTEAWRSVAELQFRIQARETRPQMLRVTGPNEIIILLVFEVRIGDVRGMLSICLPAASIESMEEKMARGWQRTRRPRTAAEEARLVARLGVVPLPVTALLETQLSARDVIALQPGDIVSLGRPATSPIDVHIGQVPRFQGRLTSHRGRPAVQVERCAYVDDQDENRQ